MARYTSPVFNIAWPNQIQFDGAERLENVIEVLYSERAFLAFAGSAKNGWAVYLVSFEDCARYQQVSPLFFKDFGDTRRDMIAACIRAYGEENNPIVNMGPEHPAEQFIWRAQ